MIFSFCFVDLILIFSFLTPALTDQDTENVLTQGKFLNCCVILNYLLNYKDFKCKSLELLDRAILFKLVPSF